MTVSSEQIPTLKQMESTRGATGEPIAAMWEHATTDSVISKDGAIIGYRQLGHGPGIVLVQGTMGTAQNFMQLAEALADTFTVSAPDRRGRGLSGPGSDEYNIQKEVEDLDALLTHTGAHSVFGLSSGAIIALQAALTLPAIHKLALFEPPFFLNGSLPTALVARYEREMADGKTAAALITGMKAGQMGPPVMNAIPRWLLERLTNMMMKSEEKKGSDGYVPMRLLASTLHNDFQLVTEMSDTLESFGAIGIEVLLLGGSKSPAYLKRAVEALSQVLPHATRIELSGLGHGAAWNSDRGGKPEQVAQELHRFFAESGQVKPGPA
ncbi:MAG: alpha/beta fold hydrolase [Thermomicrobiales bacterium]